MRKSLLFGFLMVVNLMVSQEQFSKEFVFITDNDLYVSFQKDQYYTNGLFFEYRYATKTDEKETKKIVEWQLAHKMFTPYKSIIKNIDKHDRPFAGLLYGQLSSVTHKENTIVKKSVLLGVLGPAALGRELQNFIHGLYGFKKAVGWKHQIKNTLAVNLGYEFTHPILPKNNNFIDVYQTNKLQIGTIYNDFSTGFYGRIGLKKLAKSNNSSAFGTHLNHSSSSLFKEVESFFFWKTSVTYTAFNATLQGGLFADDNDVTSKPNSLRFNLELGYLFTTKNCVFGYTYHFNTRSANSQRHQFNDYGSISIQFLFE